MASFPQQFQQTTQQVASIGCCAMTIGAVSDVELLATEASLVELRRSLATCSAVVAAEMAQRSRYELGNAGLARREGFISVTAMIQASDQSSKTDANTRVAVGTLIAEVEAARQPGALAPAPWDAPLASALVAGTLSVDAAHAIRRGLGKPDMRVSAETLTFACVRLLAEMGSANADQLFRLARQARDEVDPDGVKIREHERRAARSVTSYERADGMFLGTWKLPPENGKLLHDALMSFTGPVGGPVRFRTEEELAELAAVFSVEIDGRTMNQKMADGLIDMVRVAVDADPGTLFGGSRPSVRVIVTEKTVTARAGYGIIEGRTDGVSFETVERVLCDTGHRGIKFTVGSAENAGFSNDATRTGAGSGDGSGLGTVFDDDPALLNLGREQRLFTAKQRDGLKVQWGGCAIPGCDRSPSVCDAHHINQWKRDGGLTNPEDGIMICRLHHQLLHDHGGEIVREGTNYFWSRTMTKVPGRAPETVTVRLRSKSPLMRALTRMPA